MIVRTALNALAAGFVLTGKALVAARLRSQPDGWREVVGVGPRGEPSKFAVSCFGLRVPEMPDVSDFETRVAEQLAVFLQSEPEARYRLWHAPRITTRFANEHVDALLHNSPEAVRGTFGAVGLSILKDAKVLVGPLSDVGFPGGSFAVGAVSLPTASDRAVGAVSVKGDRAQAETYPRYSAARWSGARTLRPGILHGSEGPGVAVSTISGWERVALAVEQVRDRLRRAVAALEGAKVPYAVIGGNAVAEWVGRADPAAVRNTQDVDILLSRADFDAAKVALEAAGFVYRHSASIDMFLDGPGAKARDAVHVLFAAEKVRDEYALPAPDVTESEPGASFRVLALGALVRMKLTSNRDKDRTHLRDLIDVGLIDATWPARFPPELAARLQHVLDTPDG